MSDVDIQATVMQLAVLRTNPRYHEIMSALHRSSAQAIAPMGKDKNSVEYGNIRMVVGIWEQIAQTILSLSHSDRHRIFKCTPVSLMWKLLWPAIEQIRTGGADYGSGTPSPEYAKNFEHLDDEYHHWTQSPDGREYRSAASQAVCARFG
ncbi:MAG TPA: hypothetical protein VN670_09300 [Acidobacteriaceae bacterium]|nr:hypothetical protein [Acidobacteriaceae bacterium]